MWPWAHLGLGYLLFRATPAGRTRPIDGVAVLALAFGTQFPDLVDKPLAWYLGVLPSGRSLAHSVLTLVVVVGAVAVVARRRGRPSAAYGFAVGYVSHLVGDAYGHVLAGDFRQLTFLGWPLTPVADYGDEPGLLYRLQHLVVEPQVAFGLALAAAVLALWLRDGAPGLVELRGLGRWTADRLGRSADRW